MSKLDIINTILNSKYKDNSGVVKEDGVMNKPIQSRKASRYILYRFCEKTYNADHFADVKGLKKMCDYFMFVEYDNILYVFIIELKRTRVLSATEQLNAGECFVEYIINTANRIGKTIDISKCRIRKVRVKETSKRHIKPQVIFDQNGYFGDYCFGKFDIGLMINGVKR